MCTLRTRRHLVGLLAATVLPGRAQNAPNGTASGPVSPSAEPIHVVVASASPIETVEPRDLFDLYTGRLQGLAGAPQTLPVELARGHALRSLFYAAISSATPAQVDSHWARLQFSGRLRPPAAASDEAEMLRRLRGDPQAIGYVGAAPRDAGLRVVLRLARRPAAPA